MKKKIAVVFGGQSPEHDVSIVSALQAIAAFDEDSFDVIPVYISLDGKWYTDEKLLNRNIYIPSSDFLQNLSEIRVAASSFEKPIMEIISKSRFAKNKFLTFDIAFPIFHGKNGEDGGIQGFFDLANIPYAGMRTMASSILMDKVATKNFLKGFEIPMLECIEISQPSEGLIITPEKLKSSIPEAKFPYCVKPSHMGSSIGVSKVTTFDELAAVLPEIFKYDEMAMLEPFIENRTEYNVSVRNENGQIFTSAIEKPKSSKELLDFKEKYLSGSNKLGGLKNTPSESEGMLSLTRELNPQISDELDNKIRETASLIYKLVGPNGVPRFDFILDESNNDLWFNEVNPCPGSLGYFLWESADVSVLYPELLQKLAYEAEYLHSRNKLPSNIVPNEGMLFKRP